MSFVFNMVCGYGGGSGGGAGASLTVNSANAGTVTVSNSTLGESYARTVSAGGSVVFQGLATGVWTVTLSASGQTPSTKTVTIMADYATSIAFFTASIVITYPANSSLTVIDNGGNTVVTDTNTTATTKTYTATVSAAGTYTITATATDGSGNSSSGTAVISSSGQSVSVELSYWHNELYTPGNQWTSVTGGWQVVPVKTWTAGEPATTYAFEESAGEIGARWTAIGSGGLSKGVALMPKNKIDLTGVNAINVQLGSHENFSTGIIPDTNFLFIMENEISSSTVISTAAAARKSITASELGGELTLDVSSYSGEYYVGLAFCTNYNSPDNYCGLASMILEVGT